jgi:chemotaxis protein methyltransferase CheR
MTMFAAGTVLRMTEAERKLISDFVEREFGIKMPVSKKSLLQGRLAKRLQLGGFSSYRSYFEFITTNPLGQDEFLHFADLVSTHETSFFREPKHFEYLSSVLPSLLSQKKGTSLDLLSAACSTGEEAYSMAMTVSHSAGARRELPFFIEGVDLSERAIQVAQRGVYLQERTKGVNPEFGRLYLMNSKDREKGTRRVVPELRQRMRFHSGNLLGSPGFLRRSYDIVFCRNILIYFEPANQKRLLDSLLAHLEPKGLLFLGHSESIIGLNLSLRQVSQAVFQKA